EVDVVIFDDDFHEKYEYLKEEFNIILLKNFKALRLGRHNFGKYKFSWSLIFIGTLILRKLGLIGPVFKFLFNRFKFKYNYDLAISYSNDVPKRKDFVLSNDFVEFSVVAKKKVAWIHNDIEKLGFTKKYA